MPARSSRHNPTWLLLLAGITLVATRGAAWWPDLRDSISQSGPQAYFLFAAVFVGLTSLCFPVSVLGFTAGALYGPWLGLALLYPAGLVSGSLIFVLAKSVLRGVVIRLVQRDPRLATLERLAERRALRLNILARLSPINYGIVSYALGSGKSGFGAYFLGMLVILPSMAMQVWVGALAGHGGEMMAGEGEGGTLRLIGLVVGVLFLLLLGWQIGRMVRQALAEAQADLDREEGAATGQAPAE